MEIQEEKLKEILISQREEYQRYLGVLAENFESQLKLVIESLKGTQEQLVALREMVAKNTEDIEIIRMDLHIIKNDLIEKISREEFKIIEKRIDLLEKKFQKA
ncbi:hypothetical protein D4R86_00225 [bacterium]|nr:MAG: hypothetical protein D4R86_00225 [bacterium]